MHINFYRIYIPQIDPQSNTVTAAAGRKFSFRPGHQTFCPPLPSSFGCLGSAEHHGCGWVRNPINHQKDGWNMLEPYKYWDKPLNYLRDMWDHFSRPPGTRSVHCAVKGKKRGRKKHWHLPLHVYTVTEHWCKYLSDLTSNLCNSTHSQAEAHFRMIIIDIFFTCDQCDSPIEGSIYSSPRPSVCGICKNASTSGYFR